MKKKITILFLLFAIFPAYSEGKFILKFGSDMATSFALRPFLGANVAADYTWNSGFGLGLGIKEYWNITKYDYEAPFIGGPYGFIKFKNFMAGAGFFYSYPSMPSLYFNIGGSIPIWQLKKGSLGLDFGTELWMPQEEIIPADSPGSGPQMSDTKKALDSFKIYLGVTYFLTL